MILVLILILVLTAYLYNTINKSLLSPFVSLRNWASSLDQGKLDARLPVTGNGSFDDLANQINHLSDKLQALTEDLKSQVECTNGIYVKPCLKSDYSYRPENPLTGNHLRCGGQHQRFT